MSDHRHSAGYSRLNPEASGRFQRPAEPLKATRSDSVVEYVLFGVFIVLLTLAGIALYSQYSPSHKLVPNRVAEGEASDRINIVIIGIGGDSHPGGGKDLADAVMLLSLKPSTHQAAIVSVPRDLWVKIGSYGTHRINTAHAIGNDSGYPGEGPGLLADTVARTFGQPVHAFVRIDFKAFEKLIDDVGGVDVDVQRSFYDFLFKDGFTQGMHHFDGKRALAYARYRYIVGPEGDNFAREMRQQQVVQALRDKVRNRGPEFALHLVSIAGTLSNNTETNLTAPQMISLYRQFHSLDPASVRHVSLKPYTEKFFVNNLSDPGEAVRPRSGNYAAIQELTRNVFADMSQVGTEDEIKLVSQSIASPKRPSLPAMN
jgi:polyisoprenyl-teichoic acid--peptidoglycan teichoic acid transferase